MTSRFLPKHFWKLFFLTSILMGIYFISAAQNPIVAENNLPGTAQAIWDAHDNAPIEGFAQEFSVNKGETVHFKIDVESAVSLMPYTVKIYRLGWYQGNGARYITDLGNTLSGNLQQPYNYETSSGKVDCSNWTVSTSWVVPTTAVSGVYIARLDCPSLSAKSILLFVVRDDNPTTAAPILFKTSDATWQAYNKYGGNSFYGADIPVPGFTHATKVSYQRPLHLRTDKSNFFNSEYPMIRFLEKNGYHVSYTTDMDMSRDASVITPAKNKIILSVGHDEYWSIEERNKVETARANGVNLAFFSGNEIYWKTRWEDNYQTLVCYKEGTLGENICGGKCDPLPNVWTGLWRDGCAPAYAANDGCKPENSLSGQLSWTQSTGSIKVPDTYKDLRFWKNTSIATLGSGQTAVLPYGTLGNEWDPEQLDQTNYPAHRIILSNTVQSGNTHKMSLYRYSSGALVFAAGTMQWAWGLDDSHDLNTATPPVQPASVDVQQATVNLLSIMGADAGSLQAGLVAPTVGPDALAPSSTITYPAHNSAVAGSSITVTGTSVDNGGGGIAGVEVSINNGVTWNTATGLANWSYTFSPSGYGTITIKVRAWDDLGNVEVPGLPGSSNCINISLSGPFIYSVFNSSYPTLSPSFFTGNPVELGMKFRSSITGNITGFRYYKGPGVTGVHTGHLWDNSGNLLASQVFASETPSGWQTVTLASPVAITPNTTYVVSYFTASGEFTKTDGFFTTAVVNGFLRGLANGEDGGNGVYNYSANPSFPANTFFSANYFADVIFESNDAIAPQVLSVMPPNNSTGNALEIHPAATFTEALNPASVTRSTVTMTGPGNVLVSGTVSLTNGSVITFTPNSNLATSTTYTVTLKGGLTEPVIKDLIGNALAANYSWSFTTGSLLAPTVVTKPNSLSICANTTAIFTSTAIGIPTPTVQWQKSTDNGLTWADIPGAISGTYTFTAVYADNNNQYRAVWTNSQGHDNSIPAVLTVAETVSGTIGAVNSLVCPGSPMLLQLTSATGPSPYSLSINSNSYNGIYVGQPFRALEINESIWSPSNIPSELAVADNNSLEVGVKFKPNKDGIVKGIRFYKGSIANGGIHKGSLWTQSGTLLATATFTNETASGWQEVLFSTPVAVTANTIYVASYFLPQGNYSRTYTYFTIDRFNGKSLTALQNTVTQPNAVYAYTAQSAFPDNNYEAPNYWVDVVFAAYVPTATTTFNLTNITAANGCSVSGNPISSATITVGSATVSPGSVTGTSILCIGAVDTYVSTGDAGGVWSSSNSSVATVNPATGLVTGIGSGSADIIYTVINCNGPISALKVVNVPVNANAGTVTGTSPLCIGVTNSYTTDGDAAGVWSSSNTSVATVNGAGLVTTLTAGTTNIIYTVSSGCNSPVSSSKILIVNTNANAGVVSGLSALCIGATTIYTSNGDAGGTWSSSNTSVATVSVAGLVTVLATGTTDIIYTVNAGCNSPVSSLRTLTVGPNANAGTITGIAELCINGAATYTSNGDAGGLWSSSNTAVATVNAAGLITALSAGSTMIKYTVNTGCNSPVSSSKILAVSANANAGIVSGTSPLCIGATANYISNGDAGGAWTSSNPAVATVSATGLVTVLTTGSTDITYAVSTGCNSPVSTFKTLTVGPNANAGTITGIAELCINGTATYTSNGDAGGLWSSSNTAVATVNAAGLITALSAGSTIIKYTVNIGCNSPVSTFKTLTVGPNANAGTITGIAELCINGTATYTSNGDAGGLWSSSNTAVATVNAAGLITALSAGSTIIKYTVNTGCNSPVSSSQQLIVAPNANAGTVSGTSSLCIGATANYSSNGDADGTWSSSNPVIASVNAAGMVTALTAGTTNIIYTVGTGCNGPVSSYITLTVNANANVGIVSGTSPLCIGATTTYTNNGDAGGSWSSSNPSVASVNAAGLVTALTAGTTNITYSFSTVCSGPVSSFQQLTVAANANPGTVSGNSALCIGATATYTSNGDAGGAWSSSNPSVASVNAAGIVTALMAGTTNITYLISTGCNSPVSSFKTLTVNSNANAGTLFFGLQALCIAGTTTFTSNGDAGGVWSSSSPAIATVNAAGLVTALAEGTTNITYTVSTGCNGPAVAYIILTVNPNAKAGVVSGLSPLCKGVTTNYTTNGDAGGVWSSSNPTVASVSATGLVTAMSSGTTNITYTVSTGCNAPVSSFKTLTVSLNANAGTVSGNSPLCIAATAIYTSNGDAGGTWSSSSPAVASVNAAGLVTGLTNGTTNITYTISTGCNSPVSSFKTLTVGQNASAGTVSGNSPLCIGATATYTSSGNAGGTWSSTNPAVATVNAAGLVTALTNGTTNITYTVRTSCGGATAASSFKTLTVGLNINAGTVTGTSPLCIAATATYTSNGSTGGTWSSSNPAVATVNAAGLVTALTAGTTNIIYTAGLNCSGTAISSFKTLTVSLNASAGAVSGNSPLCIAATATYSNNGNAGGTWSSSNPAVASVNAAGLVTALTAGTTNITYTVSTGCNAPVSSFKTLTVSPNAKAGTVSGSSPLCINATATYTSNGNAGGSWSSSNPAVASVNAAGLVKGLTAGTTNITYTVSTGCNAPVSSFKTLTVNPNVSAGTVSGNSPLCIGATATYSSNGNAGGTWSSSNPAVAIVNSVGLVTTLTAGTTNIIYTVSIGCNGPVSSYKTLVVGTNTNAGTVSGNSPLCIGVTATYSSNGNTGGVWSSSNPVVATVNAAGLVTALAPGTTNITYKVSTSCGGQVQSIKTLTVRPNANAGVISGTTPYCSFQISQFTSNGDPGGTWSSSNPWVAYVTPNGYVIALFFGTANIIYTVNSGCNAPVSAYKSVTISLFPYAGIISGASTVCAGTTTNYTTNGSTGGTWSSSNTAVATVNSSSGAVTAVNAGTAVITYSVRACIGYASSSKTITVNPLTTVNAGTVSGNSQVCINATTTYTSNGNIGGTWSSSNTAVASVNATTGLVKGLTAGTSSIKYTVTPVCGNAVTSSKTVTVYSCNTFANNSGTNTAAGKTSGITAGADAKQVVKLPSVSSILKLDVYPNPSSSEFTLVLEGYSNDKVSILVTNLLGKKVYQTEGPMHRQYIFGKDFAPGIYLVQVLQAGKKQNLKLVKE